MWTILIIILILWLLGFSFEIAGNLIHILLVIALIVFIVRMLTGRKA
ncbi:lmo0937 family membrane protein [Alkalihalophilus marmarensis]|nr:lmo0937 family membrane protein [Alkalihalophilus marmarensis]MEC2071550.1 lmo0937 family membrane protein [Alkalihalophilus marmarensis]